MLHMATVLKIAKVCKVFYFTSRGEKDWVKAALLKCRWHLGCRQVLLLACGKPWKQKHEHPSGCHWIELPLGSHGKQAPLLSLSAAEEDQHSLLFECECKVNKLNIFLFVVRKKMGNASVGVRLPQDSAALREAKCSNVTLTLLAVISGVLSCLATGRAAISMAQSHRLIVDLNLEPDPLTPGGRNTN